MDTIRWHSQLTGDFTISNSGGRLLIGIEPKGDPGWYSVWADWGWEGPELGLQAPLEWKDEHGNRGRAEFTTGNHVVRICVRREGDDRPLGEGAPSVSITRAEWIEAAHALLEPTRGEFWAQVGAAQPRADEGEEADEDEEEIRWTREDGDFVIADPTGQPRLSIETDDDVVVVWAPEWDAEALELSRPLAWEDDEGWNAEITRTAARGRLRRRGAQVQIRIWYQGDDPTQVTLTWDEWRDAARALLGREQ